MFRGSCQLDFEFCDQFTDGLANRTPPLVENGIPVGERVFVHRADPPSTERW